MLPRMRYLKEAYQEIRQADPHTSLTMRGLRAIVLSGEVATVMIGPRRLINMDSLIDYLNTSFAPVTPSAPVEKMGIRRIDP